MAAAKVAKETDSMPSAKSRTGWQTTHSELHPPEG